MTRIQTPTSLNWLIKRRAKIDGERKRAIDEQRLLIEKASSNRDSLKQAEDLLAKREGELQELLAYYECALKSLDNVLNLHEVQIDTTLIKSVKQHTSPAALGHGDMARLIFKHLRENSGVASSTSEIAKYVWENTKSNRIVNFDDFRFRTYP
jgi:hypothetical protein